ncbi:DinB family protein [Amycolatopsis jejuensis]|uniref:DinB family protein n=1 Tax=Amycolatopsis jejuensis TaxID=330084 RepID=UPI001FE11EBE|nr:DinB family protein [Amycolatopsis jejuensis]
MVSPEDLDEALTSVVTALEPVTESDWTRRAGDLDWDCRQTAEHLGDVLLSYAAQVVARPADHYVRFLAKTDDDATPAELLEFIVTGARLLASAVRASDPGERAYHPHRPVGSGRIRGHGLRGTPAPWR